MTSRRSRGSRHSSRTTGIARTAATTAGLAGIAMALAAGPAQAAGDAPSGGYSFNEASQVESGSTTEQTLVAGEQLFWKIDVKPGQRLDFKVSVDLPSDYRGGGVEGLRVWVYNPLREATTCEGDTAFIGGDSPSTVKAGCTLGDAAEDDPEPLTRAGTYYLVAGITNTDENESRGRGVPMTAAFELGKGAPVDDPEPFNAGTPKPGAVVPKNADKVADEAKGGGADGDGGGSADRAAPAAASSESGSNRLALASAAVGALLLSYLLTLAAQRRRGAPAGPGASPGPFPMPTAGPPVPPAQAPTAPPVPAPGEQPHNPYLSPPNDPRY